MSEGPGDIGTAKVESGYAKPLPKIGVYDKPFWEYAKRHELRMQRCKQCGNVWFPPAPVCNDCLSQEYEWKLMSGRARVVSWVIFHQLYITGFKDEIPYASVLVHLDEGPEMITNIVGLPNEQLKVGLPVEVVFEDATPEISIPKFRPVR